MSANTAGPEPEDLPETGGLETANTWFQNEASYRWLSEMNSPHQPAGADLGSWDPRELDTNEK